MKTTRLFAAINAASFIACNGYEVTSFEDLTPATPTTLTLSCNDSDDDNEWVFKDQDIDLDCGCALAVDVSGESLSLEFSVSRPLTVEDLT